MDLFLKNLYAARVKMLTDTIITYRKSSRGVTLLMLMHRATYRTIITMPG